MYCTECGRLTTRDRFDNLIHDGATADYHTPIVEDE